MERGVPEWVTYTDLNETEYRAIREHGLIEKLEFYWTPTEERLRFEFREFPEKLFEQIEFATTVRAELADLGDNVIETVEDAYLDWSDEETKIWTEEMFDEEPTDGEQTDGE